MTEKPNTNCRLRTPTPIDAGSFAAPTDELSVLKARVQTSEQARDQYLKMASQTQADFENYQKRAARDRTEERRYATFPFAADLLPALDNLDRALAAAQEAGDNGPLAQGVALVQKQLLDALRRHGITRLEAQGQPFDPNLHQAVMQQPSSERPPMTVLQVLGTRLVSCTTGCPAASRPSHRRHFSGSGAPAFQGSNRGPFLPVLRKDQPNMPTYEYECDACQHRFEEFQSMKDAALQKCPKCTKPKLRRLFGTGAAILFKGSGFYETDYRSESYKSRGPRRSADAGKPAAKTDTGRYEQQHQHPSSPFGWGKWLGKTSRQLRATDR